MHFRIADTFTASLGRLTAAEQKAAKTTAFDLQVDPSSPGLSFHRPDSARDPNFWSVRANADIRIIVHRAEGGVLLCYVGHHDDAYRWAERRKIERHPVTGAMQLVEIREGVEQGGLSTPRPAATAAPHMPKPLLFDGLRKAELMSFGVPEEWVDDVRRADEDTLFDIVTHLPQEAQEALLKLAVGEQPEPPQPAPAAADPFAHPDAQRRFRVLDNVDELRQALDYPWEKWIVFQHPAQRELVQRRFAGPARVSGSAGTGKTIVAIHRAVHLARGNPSARVLLTTYSRTLAHSLKSKVALLTEGDTDLSRRITAKPLSAMGHDLHAGIFGQPNMAAPSLIRSLLDSAARDEAVKFGSTFLFNEWADVVDAWQVASWEGYAKVQRLGRKTRIGQNQREALWRIVEKVRAGLRERKTETWASLFGGMAAHYAGREERPFDFVVVDEAQDLTVAEARFLAAIAGDRVDGLFLAGDLGQRIFQQAFSWKSLGIDLRGRSAVLRVNYRTSHQIRARADRLLPVSVSDTDGNTESRIGTVSVFDGGEPEIAIHASADAERNAVGHWIGARLRDGLQPEEVGVFVRSEKELPRARAAVKAAGAEFCELDGRNDPTEGQVAVGTMHLAKGLEFRAVAVMACDEDILPSQERIESVADESDLQEVYDTERHLLYVACTRARDDLMISGVSPGSEFLRDFGGRG